MQIANIEMLCLMFIRNMILITYLLVPTLQKRRLGLAALQHADNLGSLLKTALSI